MKKHYKKRCDIRAETKLRNGYPNWWCHSHHCSARGKNGEKLSQCLLANQPPITDKERIYIDLNDYPGGVGIWGALEAVYDSKQDEPEKGVHVHLRNEPNGNKVVDNTFREVYIKIPQQKLFDKDEWIMIDEFVACAYTASTVFEKQLKVIKCKHCGREHIDADYFAVHVHKKHLCTFCGRDFLDSDHGISNPIFNIQKAFHETMKDRKLEKTDRKLIVSQKDFPGGIQIWGSNPAIIWSAPRMEESGIHVHLFKEPNSIPFSDETYGYVEIDEVVLDDEMIRYYMVQKSMEYLSKYVKSLICPICNKDHFDKLDKALNPHKNHECEHCGAMFSDGTRLKGTVSNPIMARLKKLEAIRQSFY